MFLIRKWFRSNLHMYLFRNPTSGIQISSALRSTNGVPSNSAGSQARNGSVQVCWRHTLYPIEHALVYVVFWFSLIAYSWKGFEILTMTIDEQHAVHLTIRLIFMSLNCREGVALFQFHNTYAPANYYTICPDDVLRQAINSNYF